MHNVHNNTFQALPIFGVPPQKPSLEWGSLTDKMGWRRSILRTVLKTSAGTCNHRDHANLLPFQVCGALVLHTEAAMTLRFHRAKSLHFN